ncbi:hypothetical protein QWA68_001639 [Fusarium oxysporum]|nr:hypothetical protein QWA68_001639 [Fusarium oxysporum]
MRRVSWCEHHTVFGRVAYTMFNYISRIVYCIVCHGLQCLVVLGYPFFGMLCMPSYSDVNPTNDSWLVISCRPFKWAVAVPLMPKLKKKLELDTGFRRSSERRCRQTCPILPYRGPGFCSSQQMGPATMQQP